MASMSVAVGCGDNEGDAPGAARTATQADSATPRETTTQAETAPGTETARPRGDGGAEAEPDGPSPNDPDTEKQRVAQVVSGMYEDLVQGDAAGVCAAMSTSVREEIAQNVPGGSTEAPENRTCEGSFSKFLGAAAGSGLVQRTLDTEVKEVRIDGRRATATVSISGRTGRVQLAKEDGQWRFGSAPLGGSR
jgi:hypothetical protein